ncbi:CDP-diacylglycerol diphosphatase [Enterobacter asburiae]
MKISSIFLPACLLCAGAAYAAVPNPDSLWEIVHQRCVPDFQELNTPSPCEKVDLTKQYAILNDTNKHADRLLIPTIRIVGIENMGEAQQPNFWAYTWQAKPLLDDALKKQNKRALLREETGMAVNSAARRSQTQLHIHLDCLRPDVIQALKKRNTDISLTQTDRQWQSLSYLDPQNRNAEYRVMRVGGTDMANIDPFRLVYDALADKASMALHTIVVAGVPAGADHPEGFYILDGVASEKEGNHGSGERLLDHECKILN